jgi:hypothetical protein
LDLGKATVAGEGNDECTQRSHRGNGDGTQTQETDATREAPTVVARDRQPDAREGQAGPCGVAERFVVPKKLVNAGGGKGPQFQVKVQSSREPVD